MPQRRVLTVPEAGAELGLCRGAAYAAAKRGELPTLKIGGRLLVPRVALDRLLESVAEQVSPSQRKTA